MAPTRIPLLPPRSRVGAFVCAAVAMVSVVTVAQLSPMVPVPAAIAVCQAPLLDCTSGSVAGGGVSLIRTKTKPGSAAKPVTKTSGGAIFVVPAPSWTPNVLAVVCAVMRVRPWYCPAPAAPKITAAKPATPSVSLSDIAGFVPRSPALVSEPAGWAIAGLPANFIASEPTHDVTGSLLGSGATVRFTPVSYSWSYGDDHTQNTTTAGTTWAALGLASFSPTATSHVYTSAGVFVIRVTVTLHASYRLGSGAWVAIAGSLTRTTSVSIRVAQGSAPVLVTGDCLPHPSAVGC